MPTAAKAAFISADIRVTSGVSGVAAHGLGVVLERQVDAARGERAQQPTDGADRVGQVGQHQPAEHGVHRLVGTYDATSASTSSMFVTPRSANLVAAYASPSGARSTASTDPSGADQLGDQQRDLAGAGAEIDHPHAGADPGQLQREPGGRLQHLCLPVQPRQLLGAMAEHVVSASPMPSDHAPIGRRGPPRCRRRTRPVVAAPRQDRQQDHCHHRSAHAAHALVSASRPEGEIFPVR